MPGKRSLQDRQYYAHPRNSFWPILGAILAFDPSSHYHERTRRLEHAGIALWDVLKSCARSSSLDSDIEGSSMVANDFEAFFMRHPDIQTVLFNGGTAEQVFMRQVWPGLRLRHRSLELHRLPSTSPAHARMNQQEKLNIWRQYLA